MDLAGGKPYIETALRLNPDSYEARLCAGNLALAERDYPTAIRHLETAIALDPLAYRPAGMIVQAYVGIGDQQHVEVAARRLASRCEKLLESEPDHGGALGHMVAALAELGEADRAREWARRAQLFDPDNVRLLYNIACGMARMGALDASRALLAPPPDTLGSATPHT